MSLIRIMVDGYSLLHRWPELAPGNPRHSGPAREELVQILRQYRDAIGTPITIVFDGNGPVPNTDMEAPSTPELEILYSKAGQTADDIIERVSHRLKPYGDFLVVTDDVAERDTVMTLGGLASSCRNFIEQVRTALRVSSVDLEKYNLRERRKFKNSPLA